jgi:capsular polysaccharide transport system permease protein
LNTPASIEPPALRVVETGNTAPDVAATNLAPPPVVAPSQIQRRHMGLMLSFLALVVLPTLISGWYLWARAADRYVSETAFSVRNADTSSALQLLSGIGQLGVSSSTSDTDILYQFIQSQELVSKIDAEIDLRKIWSKADPKNDPVFAYHPPGTIEDLMHYWPRMVKVFNDSGTGILNVQVQAFSPEDAQTIAQMIYDDSSKMINRLSAIAREDATRYAREDRDESLDRLKLARTALTAFRNRTQIVDPAASVQNQMGLLSSLQTQLAEALISRATLRDTVAVDDPRVKQEDRRIEVIKAQIALERKNLGLGSSASGDNTIAFADLVGEYERLSVDQQFAEQTYTAAMAAYDAAAAESRRQSRYLAAHVNPTLAQASEQPQRLMLLSLVALFAFLLWSVVLLVFYALRDRR